MEPPANPAWFNPDLIAKRTVRDVPMSPGGTLSDYIPFYFTPYSPMMYNIHTGRGVRQRSNDEILVLVASLRDVHAQSLPFVFADRHAYLQTANYYNDLSDLDRVSFKLLQTRKFQRNPDDPESFERYQAEALIYQTLPASALRGVVCYDDKVLETINHEVSQRGLTLATYALPAWYF